MIVSFISLDGNPVCHVDNFEKPLCWVFTPETVYEIARVSCGFPVGLTPLFMGVTILSRSVTTGPPVKMSPPPNWAVGLFICPVNVKKPRRDFDSAGVS